VPASIASDCSVEVTAQLNAWIAQVPDGTATSPTTIDFAPSGCYWVDHTVAIGGVNATGTAPAGRHYLYVEGNGATLQAKNLAPPGVGRDELRITTGDNITVHNLNAVGVNTVAQYNGSYEHDGNFGISGTTNVTLDDVHGYGAYGDFVDTGPQEFSWPTVETVSNFTLKNSSADVTGRHGVTCTDCNGFTVDHNTFDNIGYDVMDVEVEDASWSAHHVRFTNNTIGHVHLIVFANAGQSHDIGDVTVSGNVMNTVSGSCFEPIYIDWTSADPVHRPGPYVISGNKLYAYSDVVWVNRADNVTVQGNTSIFMNGGCRNAGVIASSSVGGSVTGNDFTGEATAFQNFDGLSTGYTICGNKLAASGAFNQPAAC